MEVILLERSSRVGGTIRTLRRDGFLLETGPDSFISEKPEALELARRLGLEHRLIQTNSEHRRSFIVREGRLLPVPEGFQLLAPSRIRPFLTSGIFSWQGKARMALELLLPRRTERNGSYDESLAEFVRRRFGHEALERMAQPMVGGIYTADPEKLSLKATMPRFLEMERKHRSLIWAMWKNGRKINQEQMRGTSGARYSLFLSFDEGMQLLSDTLAARLPAGVVRLNTNVERVLFDKEKSVWTIHVRGEEEIQADAVCIALPGYAAGALLSEVDAPLASELEAIPYASTATVNLAWKREDIPHALDGFGFSLIARRVAEHEAGVGAGVQAALGVVGQPRRLPELAGLDAIVLQPGEEALAVDRPVDHHRGHQPVGPQRGHERGRLPVPVRDGHDQPLADRLAQEHEAVQVLHRERKQGLGRAYRDSVTRPMLLATLLIAAAFFRRVTSRACDV